MTTLARVLGVVGLCVALSGCASSGEPTQPSHTTVRELTEPLTQSFVPRGQRLARVELLVATFAQTSVGGTVCMDLRGAGEARDDVCVDATSLSDGAWAAFGFAPIAHADGATFEATFRYDGPNRVAVYVNPHDPYPDGALEPGPGDLAFQLGHAGRVSETLRALGRSLTEFGGRLADDPLFTIAWIVVIGAVGALLVAARLKHRAAAPD